MKKLLNNSLEDQVNSSILEFVEKTKEGIYCDDSNIPKDYIIRYDLPDEIDIYDDSNEVFLLGISS